MQRIASSVSVRVTTNAATVGKDTVSQEPPAENALLMKPGISAPIFASLRKSGLLRLNMAIELLARLDLFSDH